MSHTDPSLLFRRLTKEEALSPVVKRGRANPFQTVKCLLGPTRLQQGINIWPLEMTAMCGFASDARVGSFGRTWRVADRSAIFRKKRRPSGADACNLNRGGRVLWPDPEGYVRRLDKRSRDSRSSAGAFSVWPTFEGGVGVAFKAPAFARPLPRRHPCFSVPRGDRTVTPRDSRGGGEWFVAPATDHARKTQNRAFSRQFRCAQRLTTTHAYSSICGSMNS